MEQSDGLSNGYARNEGKFIADQIVHFKSTYLQNIVAPKIKEVDLNIQRIANKARFEFYVGIYNATNQTTLLKVFANRKTSSDSLTTRIPEDQPTNLVVKLILILLILPQ